MAGTSVDVELAGQGIGLAGSVAGVSGAIGAASSAGTGATILGVSGITVGVGLATLGIGAGLAILIMELFKGANPLQVPAAKAEQIYEAAADNMLSLEKAGVITQAQAIAGMQALITAGQQEEASLQSQIGTPAVKGSTNLTSVIQAEIVDAENVNPLPMLLTGLTLQQAEEHYYIDASNENGWYPQSVTDAVAVTDQIATQFLVQNQPVPVSAVAQASAASVNTQPAGTARTAAQTAQTTKTTETNATTAPTVNFFSTSTGHLILLAALGLILWKAV